MQEKRRNLSIRVAILATFIALSSFLGWMSLKIVELFTIQLRMQLLASMIFLFYVYLIGILAYGFMHLENSLTKPVLPVRIKKEAKKLSREKIIFIIGNRIAKIPGFKQLSMYFAEKIAGKLRFAHIFLYPVHLVAFYLAISLIAFISLLTASIIGFSLLKNPIIFLIPFISLALIFLPHLEVNLRISNRKSYIDNELPFFITYAAILQNAGLSLYSAFKRIIGRGILPKMEEEAMVIERDYKYFTYEPLTALEEIAREHPHEEFKTFIFGYTSLLRSGGNLQSYLEAKVNDGLNLIKAKWRKFAGDSANMGETMIIIFTMIPTLILALAISFATESSLLLMSVYTYFLLPLIALVIALSIHSVQPKFYDKYDVLSPLKYSTVAAAISFFIVFKIINQFYIGVGILLLIFSIPIAVSFFIQYYEISKVEEALPSFLRDVTELRKIGYSITQAIISLSRWRSYNTPFDKLLKFISKQLRLNMSFKLLVERLRVRSWLLKYSLFVLSEMMESGGGSPQVLESLTSFVNDVHLSKKRTKSNVRIYMILAYITPILLIIIISMFRQLALSVMTLYPAQVALPGGFTLTFSQSLLEKIIDLSLLSYMLTSFLVGIIAAKICDLSVFSFRHVIVVLAIALVSVTFLHMQIPLTLPSAT